MLTLNPFLMVTNGVIIALALAFLLIIVWYNALLVVNQFFSIFLLAVIVWNLGILLIQASLLTGQSPTLSDPAVAMSQIGFTAASVTIYVLVTIIAGVYPKRFRILAFSALAMAIAYHLLTLTADHHEAAISAGHLSLVLPGVYFLIFDTAALYVTWRYRRKIHSRGLLSGIAVFVCGQGLTFLNPGLGIVALATTISALGALVLSFAFVQRELIAPVAERDTQLTAMHEVSLAITTQITADAVLREIAERATGWLEADAAAIFLLDAQSLELAAVHRLPVQWLNLRWPYQQGIAGHVVASNHAMYVENYHRDWVGQHMLPLAEQTFGSVICVPLDYGGQAIGALMVIAGREGRSFQPDDVNLLEQLGAQAAVAIAHGQLFAAERRLSEKLSTAHDQLHTVLVSTENPVIAVDRKLRVIFANPAAEALFAQPLRASGQPLAELISPSQLPADYRAVLRDLRQSRVHVYDVRFGDKVYLCHIARLGRDKIDGWVAVLNDVTQLKELDRIKSEMVRMTSHDLKNPLQAAISNLELLREDLSDVSIPEVHMSINNIEKQIRKMQSIIRGILDLERARAGLGDVEKCDAVQIVAAAIREVSDFAATRKISLIQKLEPDVAEFWGHRNQFHRAIVNLIENAVKFTPSGGKVWVSAVNHAGQVRVIVKDTGIGIPESLHTQIFERFFRGHQPGSEDTVGSGLGLNLVKTVVENHRGRIQVESTPGQGATFIITIPAADHDQSSSPDNPSIVV